MRGDGDCGGVLTVITQVGEWELGGLEISGNLGLQYSRQLVFTV